MIKSHLPIFSFVPVLVASSLRICYLIWSHKDLHLCFLSFRAFSSVQFSRSVMSNSLWPHEPGLRVHHQLRVYSNSCPSQWCHPAISSSVVPFSSIPLGLTIYVIDPFWVTFCVWSKSGVQLYSFACRHQLLPAPPVGETIFFIDWYWHPC